MGAAEQIILPEIENFEVQYLRLLRHMCMHSLLAFTRFFHSVKDGSRFIINEHHWIIARCLQEVLEGKRKRLLINIPPGYSKTQMAVIDFSAWGLAHNPRARFIHTSYSDDLALLNSTYVRDTIETEYYQAMWPMKFRKDTQAKKRWTTEFRGGMYAAAAGGQITGFRAGRMESGFTGALIIDDPVKADDAFSDIARNKVNRRFNNTFKSRLATEDVPIIVIMQRLHEDDLTGYLAKGGSGDIWDHLIIPAEISEDPEPYPDEYTHGRPIKIELPPGPLWDYKHNQEELDKLKVDKYTYFSQYQQSPTPDGGGLFNPQWWNYYESYDSKKNIIYLKNGQTVRLVYKMIFADTAMKIKERNDWSVFQCWGKGADGNLYLIEQVRGKWEAPDLKTKFIKFCERHDYDGVNGNAIGTRARYVEDKSSGTGLIQEILRIKGHGYVLGIQRDIDKVSRARSALPAIAEGYVYLPKNAYWLPDYLLEFKKFTPTMAHRYDDQIDPTLDAIHKMHIVTDGVDYSAAL